MNTQKKLAKIRTKKLGLLMYDARIASRKSLEECAQAMGIAAQKLSQYEKGLEAPSLPEIEALAFFLDIPLEHFWSHQSLNETPIGGAIQQAGRLNQIRQRIIGTSLRLARNRQNISQRELSEKSGIPEAQLRSYEAGETAIPLPDLELLASALDMRVEEFFDRRGPIGNWRAQQQAIQKFLDLPQDIQNFICKPVNRPYLDLAMRLSELSVEKLRSVAEGLLEITY